VATKFGTFTKTNPDTGQVMERVAHTVEDAVKYRFDGWVEKPAAKPASAPSSTSSSK
jgi:hypothetical protein